MPTSAIRRNSLEDQSPQLRDPKFFISESFFPLLARLRSEDPVHWTQAWDDRGFWSVTRYRDIREVLLKPTIYSSQELGSLMPADPHMYDTAEAKAAAAFGLMPTYTDPPRHDAIRRPFMTPFSPKAVDKLAKACQSICDELIDDILEKAECDFVSEVASKLPMHIICMMMGIAREDWDYIARLVNSFICNTEPDLQLGATPAETMQIAQRAQFEYIRKIVDQRRSDPKEDLTTLATVATVDGEPISPEESFWWAWAMLVGGFETSRNVMAGGLLALLQNPDQMERLRQSPAAGKDAAEELARWTSPGVQVLRVAKEDGMVGNRLVKTGDWLVLWLSSANRDEEIFDAPNRLDLARRPNPHLAFGYGTHICLGRNVALLQIKHLIDTVLRRLSHIELAGAPEWTASTIAMGVKKLPIRYRPQ